MQDDDWQICPQYTFVDRLQLADQMPNPHPLIAGSVEIGRILNINPVRANALLRDWHNRGRGSWRSFSAETDYYDHSLSLEENRRIYRELFPEIVPRIGCSDYTADYMIARDEARKYVARCGEPADPPAEVTSSSGTMPDPPQESHKSQRNSDSAQDSSTSYINPDNHAESGSQDAENCLLNQGIEHESEFEPQFGETGQSDQVDIIIDGDSPMNYDLIVARFHQNSRDLSPSTIENYIETFDYMTKSEHLERYTPKQLAGKKGKEIIVNYILDPKKVSEKSQHVEIAGLKAIWRRGMGIPFPCEKWDFGSLPEVGRRNSPRNPEVKPHIDAVEHEEDPYLKVLVLLIIQFGIRVSHACLFCWHHVEYRNGRPYSIITTGLEKGNKRKVPVVAYIPPDLADALLLLKTEIPDAGVDDPILPRRKRSGEYEIHTPMRLNQFDNQWIRFEAKHHLKHWAPVYFRHYHTSKCAEARLRKPFGKAMRGQKYNIKDMEEVYDNPDQLTILEEQKKILPYGIIGFVCPKNVELEELPDELAKSLLAVTTGKMKKSEFDDILTAWLLRKADNTANTGDMVIR